MGVVTVGKTLWSLFLILLLLLFLVIRVVFALLFSVVHRCVYGSSSQGQNPANQRHRHKYVSTFLASKCAEIVTKGPGITPRLDIRAPKKDTSFAPCGDGLQNMQSWMGAGHVVGRVLIIDDPVDLRRVLQRYIMDAQWPTDYYSELMDKPPSKQQAMKALQALRMKELQAQRRPSKAAKKKSSRAANANQQDSPTAHSASGETLASSSSNSSSSTCTADSAVSQQPTVPHRTSDGDDYSATSQNPAAAQSSSTDATHDTYTAGADQHEQQPKKKHPRQRHKHTCASCGGKGLKCCGVCRDAWYCGADCQAADWPEHKKVCSPKQE